jgi:hypothetical protein
MTEKQFIEKQLINKNFNDAYICNL